MIRFLLKGILRDKTRSLLPVIVVSIGVMLTIFLSAYLTGVFGDVVDINAKFSSGHVKIMTRAYAENKDQVPNDLALMGVNELISNLENDYPEMEWVSRTYFGGLIDVPDENGETRAQGTAAGRAVDLFSPDSKEVKRMNIANSIVKGTIPEKPGEAIISDDFAERFNVNIGDKITLFGSTMDGSMVFYNFTVSGTIRFGPAILDRGAILIDISDAQLMLDMEDAASEVLGYFNDGIYDTEKASLVKNAFNVKYSKVDDEFSPQMFKLEEDSGLVEYLQLADSMSEIMVAFFIIAMSIVLWNTGLLGGLRRYTEYGIRLALGEEKKHIFKTIIYEAVLIGLLGSVIGTAIGIGFAYYFQKHGFDFSSIMDNVTMMFPQVFRTVVKPEHFYIGFIPGLAAVVLGNALAGLAIYKRKTAKLFKELEV
ncbi:MAG: FtsX-like permease family protein [Bacteroidota bacterium]